MEKDLRCEYITGDDAKDPTKIYELFQSTRIRFQPSQKQPSLMTEKAEVQSNKEMKASSSTDTTLHLRYTAI